MEHFSEDFSSCPWYFYAMRSVQFSSLNSYFWGLGPISGIWMGLMAHLPVLEAYSDLCSPWGLLSFSPYSLPLRVEAQQAGWRRCPFFLDLWQKGMSREEHRSPPRLGVLVRAVHSPPLCSEPFASVLISLEIDMLIFFCTILSTMSELLTFKIFPFLTPPFALLAA